MASRLEQMLRARAVQRPVSALLELTYHCNWRCTFCYNPRHFDRTQLTAEEWSIVLDDLRSLGTLEVTITGGEPLTHRQFFEIVREARERYFAVAIFTNGSLIDERCADRIAELTPTDVEISIHGADEATHGAATGTSSSLQHSLRGARLLVERGVRVKVKTVLTKRNESQLHAIRALAESTGARFQVDPVLLPRDGGDLSPLAERATDAGLREAYRFAAAVGALQPLSRREGASNCALGTASIAIDPEGNVYPCPRWRTDSMGNVRERRVTDMWLNSAVRSTTAGISAAANETLRARGGDVAAMSFCPAVAMQRTGNALAVDEDLATRARIAGETLSEGA
jgi:AdoMet-dependent heme synthase